MQTFWKNVEDMFLPFLLKYFENGPYIQVGNASPHPLIIPS